MRRYVFTRNVSPGGEVVLLVASDTRTGQIAGHLSLEFYARTEHGKKEAVARLSGPYSASPFANALLVREAVREAQRRGVRVLEPVGRVSVPMQAFLKKRVKKGFLVARPDGRFVVRARFRRSLQKHRPPARR